MRSSGRLKNCFNRHFPGKGYKKAIVAVARKILRIAWHLLVNDEEFVDEDAKSKDVWIPKMPSVIQKNDYSGRGSGGYAVKTGHIGSHLREPIFIGKITKGEYPI